MEPQTTAGRGYRLAAVSAEIVIREPRPGDGRDMAQIWLEFATYYAELDPGAFRIPRREGLVEWFEAANARDLGRLAHSVVAEVDGRVVGFAAGSIREPEEDAEYQLVADVTTPRLDIDVVATAKHFWRRGVARRLVEALEDWAREHGAEIALATTYIESPISIPFWEQGVGYERRAIRYIKRL